MIKAWTLCAIALALLAGVAAAADAPTEADGTGDDSGSVLVGTIVAAQGALPQPVTAYGVVQAAPSGTMAVSALHAAQVIGLRVVAGQTVTAGEPLLDLGADPAAALAYAQAQSDLDLARGELDRTRKLAAERLATNSQVAQAEKAVRDAQAAIEARRREGAGKAVETIASPIAGVVTAVAVSNGDHVQPGATLLDLASGAAQTGLLGLAPGSRARVKPGQQVRLFDLDAPGAPIAGTVAAVGGVADPKTGLFTLVAKPAPGARLAAGAHLRATIATEPASGWIVPRDSVLTDDDGPFVFQVNGGKAARVAVEILGEADDRFAVAGRLDPTRKLVVSGAYQLSDGMAVREQSASGPANPDTGKP